MKPIYKINVCLFFILLIGISVTIVAEEWQPIPDADWNSAKAFGAAVKELFSSPLATTSGTGTTHELTIEDPGKVNYIMIQEDIRQGQRVKEYMVERDEGDGKWKELVKAITIGHKKIDLFKPVPARKLRLKITESYKEPVITNFSAFYSPRFEEIREYIEEDYI